MLNPSVTSAQTLVADTYNNNKAALAKSVERLARGQQINSAADNPAGIAAMTLFKSQIAAKSQAIQNIINAHTMIQTAEAALTRTADSLGRMLELTLEAKSVYLIDDDRTPLNLEFASLVTDIQTISMNTQWQGHTLFDGSLGAVNVQIGSDVNQTFQMLFADLNTDFGDTEASQAGTSSTTAADLDLFVNLSVDNASTTAGDEHIDLAAQGVLGSAQETTIAYLDRAISRISSHQYTLQVATDQLTQTSELLGRQSYYLQAANDRLMLPDESNELAQLTRAQIVQQAGSARLAQANISANLVASLLSEK